jgi:hypothetical protein
VRAIYAWLDAEKVLEREKAAYKAKR